MIVNNTEILSVVGDIDMEYNKPTTTTHYAILFSKLAVIEFCGWIEQTIDALLNDYSHSKLTGQPHKNYLQEVVISPNYGFHYEKNLRKMFLSVIGVKNLEHFENSLEANNGYFLQLKSILGTFSTSRNRAAHTYTPHGTTITYDSPSIVKSNIVTITPILQEIERLLTSY